MTETEKKRAVSGSIPVDAKKMIDALGTIFGGVIQLLKATEPSIAKELADMAINGVLKSAADAGTENQDTEFIVQYVHKNYDLTPRGIIDTLGLLDVDYNKVSAYGHFGKQRLPWEK